jgi:hypothetical protein
MKTREISRNGWAEFFNSFSRQHEGSLSTLELFGPEIGNQVEERELAFEGITAELSVAEDKIAIMIGAKPDRHITHSIRAPNQVSLEQSDEFADLTLAIKAADGTMSLLRFCTAVLPEVVAVAS